METEKIQSLLSNLDLEYAKEYIENANNNAIDYKLYDTSLGIIGINKFGFNIFEKIKVKWHKDFYKISYRSIDDMESLTIINNKTQEKIEMNYHVIRNKFPNTASFHVGLSDKNNIFSYIHIFKNPNNFTAMCRFSCGYSNEINELSEVNSFISENFDLCYKEIINSKSFDRYLNMINYFIEIQLRRICAYEPTKRISLKK